jgi:orotate phosphoribosyltransferase
MIIEVKLFATLDKFLPPGSQKHTGKIDVPEGTCAARILEKLGIPPDMPKIILINGIHSSSEDLLKEGDTLALFPPLAGGELLSDEVLDDFRQSGALLEGHFLLSSGLHSPQYLQCALVLQYPELAEKLGQALAEAFGNDNIQVVVSPALGGIVIGQEVAKALGARAIFCERQDGKMTLRRGFTLYSGERALVIEDVMTTGGSTREVIEVVKGAGAQIIGAGALIDRSGGKVDLGVKKVALATRAVPTFKAEECPQCKEGAELVKPGSK